MKSKRIRNSNGRVDEKMKLLGDSLTLLERLKKMRAVGATPRDIGIDPRILKIRKRYNI